MVGRGLNLEVHNDPIGAGQGGVEPPGVLDVPGYVKGNPQVETTEGVTNQPARYVCKNYRVDHNAVGSTGAIVVPPLPLGHTFVVTSSLMQMLTSRVLFVELPLKDPYSHMSKVKSVCLSSVGRLDLDMDAIDLREFPLSLTGDATI